LQSQIDVAGLPAIPAGGFETESVLKLCAGSTTPQWGPCLDLYAIGDVGPAGGIVFHITDGGAHGLEAAPEDLPIEAEWGCDSVNLEFLGAAGGEAVGTGAQNTDDLAGCAPSPFYGNDVAAQVVMLYELNGAMDWFLPSKDELNLMYTNLHLQGIGGFFNINYWSSTRYPGYYNGYAYAHSFNTGNAGAWFRQNLATVRAIRTF
jgi:hypothetical protein